MGKIKLLIIGILFMTSVHSRSYEHRRDSSVFIHLNLIKHYLDSLGVEEVYYVLAQSAYESGWFNCKNCSWNNNNMFGFRASNGKYMKFSSWQECAIYYSNWQKKRYSKYKDKFPKGTYLGFLKWCKYAESQNYIKSIQGAYGWIMKNWNS